MAVISPFWSKIGLQSFDMLCLSSGVVLMLECRAAVDVQRVEFFPFVKLQNVLPGSEHIQSRAGADKVVSKWVKFQFFLDELSFLV